MEASSALYFWDHYTAIQIVAKPTAHRSTENCTCIFIVTISKPVLKPEVFSTDLYMPALTTVAISVWMVTTP